MLSNLERNYKLNFKQTLVGFQLKKEGVLTPQIKIILYFHYLTKRKVREITRSYAFDTVKCENVFNKHENSL